MYKIYIKKTLLIMRITILLLIFLILQVHASSFGQRISLSVKGAPLISVLQQIRAFNGTDYLVSQQMLDKAIPITMEVKDIGMRQALDQIFKDQPLTYVLKDKFIVVKIKQPSFLEHAKAIIHHILRDSSLNGIVLDEQDKPLIDASIQIKGSSNIYKTGAKGEFSIANVQENAILIIRYVGYKTITLTLKGQRMPLTIKMEVLSNELKTIEITYSNGFQNIPKERSTGSFEVITAKMLEHSNSPSLLKRLEGITTGLNFNNNRRPTNSAVPGASALSTLTIRGRNTFNELGNDIDNAFGLNKSGWPLVVIDGVANPYPIDHLNPDNVESVTILKDAAAASIWGSRAANGVLVIKTKRGRYEASPQISFNSSFTLTGKLNLFYRKKMNIADFVDAQAEMFSHLYPGDSGLEDPAGRGEKNNPIFEILDQQKKGRISSAEATVQLDALKNNDVRRDFTKYFFRPASTQTYFIGINGGTENRTYSLSANYNKSSNNTRGSGQSGSSISYNTSIKPHKNLEISGSINYGLSNSKNQSSNQVVKGINYDGEPFHIFSRLADDQGRPLTIQKDYRQPYLDLLKKNYRDSLLDMSYSPLRDIQEGHLKNNIQSLAANLIANYRINSILSAEINYNYSNIRNEEEQLDSKNSYYMRNMINLYTDPLTLNRAVPLGGLYVNRSSKTTTQSLRAQFNLNKSWGKDHSIFAIAGLDASTGSGRENTNSLYGYEQDPLTAAEEMDFRTEFPKFDGETDAIESYINVKGNEARSLSSYMNASYSFKEKYSVSGSIRKDGSNAFGLETNRTGKPFFSYGASWNIAKEPFMHKISWLPSLSMRATYGYNGNANTTIGPTPTIIKNQSNSESNFKYASLGFITNSLLRPERTSQVNLGLDFGFEDEIVTGTINYYDKQTKDLIAPAPIDLNTGTHLQSINVGNIHGYGMDLSLNSRNLRRGNFVWNTMFLLSYNRVKVTKAYTREAGLEQVIAYQPIEGQYLDGLRAYKWAGLSHDTGEPMIYINGKAENNKNEEGESAYNSGLISDIHFFGSSVPVYDGNLTNSFSYGTLALSFNLACKLNYYAFRPEADMLTNSNLFGPAEYSQRWKKPGDELHTNVPFYNITGTQTNDDSIYPRSDINTIKADHIRLQQINLSYSIKSKFWRLKKPRIDASINNLGIIWRANKLGIDPDIMDYPQPRSYSFRFSANF